MLSLLPQILFLSVFAIAAIRLTVTGMLAYNAWFHFSDSSLTSRVVGVIETLVAAALFVGAWTQLAAILGSIVLIASLLHAPLRIWPRSTIALLLIMTLTLVFTGPGAVSFDLPL